MIKAAELVSNCRKSVLAMAIAALFSISVSADQATLDALIASGFPLTPEAEAELLAATTPEALAQALARAVDQAVRSDPDQAAAIVRSAITAAPDLAAAITSAAVSAAPDRAALITQAALESNPEAATEITAAAIAVAPEAEEAILAVAEEAISELTAPTAVDTGGFFDGNESELADEDSRVPAPDVDDADDTVASPN